MPPESADEVLVKIWELTTRLQTLAPEAQPVGYLQSSTASWQNQPIDAADRIHPIRAGWPTSSRSGIIRRLIRKVRIMKRVIVLLALVAIVGHAVAKPLPTAKPSRVGMSADRLQRIDDVTQKYVDAGKLAGVVTMVARNGKVVYFDAVGNRGADDETPLKKDDLFRIYSMSKPITAVAAMQLYEQGKFHLSDPVSKFVPELKDLMVMGEDGELTPSEKTMTMHHLLTHTAGFSYGFQARTDAVDKAYAEAKIWGSRDLTAFAETLAKLPLKFEPGTRWHYSVAVDVTGLVVERISGQPFDEYLAEHVFAPLGMEDTFFAVPEDKRDRFLPNHFWNPETKSLVANREVQPAAMSDYFNVSLFSGGGGLVSTASDYMRFAESIRNGGSLQGKRILGAKTINYMRKNHLPGSVDMGGSGENPLAAGEQRGLGFGLGFGVVTDAVKSGTLGSDGEYQWGGAAGTLFWIDPVEEVVVVGMIQLMGSRWPLRADMRVGTYQALTESYE